MTKHQSVSDAFLIPASLLRPRKCAVALSIPAGDKKAGSVRILYDTTWSTRGVLQAVGRKPRAKDPFDFQVRPQWETLPDMSCSHFTV